MTDAVPAGIPTGMEPAFQSIADQLAMRLAGYSPDELQTLLRVNKDIARENWLRYRHYADRTTRIPAVFAYDGMVFRKLSPESMSTEDLCYADRHLFIGSFLYGLLRPLDMINPYRLEGDVELPCTGQQSLFDYWKPILTDWFIAAVKADDGVLVNLASNEFKDIFDWKKVTRELTVITPEFKVEKDGRLRTVVIYAKMCRGAMSRWIIRNRLTDINQLRDFAYDGFRHESAWTFTLR